MLSICGHVSARNFERAPDAIKTDGDVRGIYLEAGSVVELRSTMTNTNPLRYFRTPPLFLTSVNLARHKGRSRCSCRDWFEFV